MVVVDLHDERLRDVEPVRAEPELPVLALEFEIEPVRDCLENIERVGVVLRLPLVQHTHDLPHHQVQQILPAHVRVNALDAFENRLKCELLVHLLPPDEHLNEPPVLPQPEFFEDCQVLLREETLVLTRGDQVFDLATNLEDTANNPPGVHQVLIRRMDQIYLVLQVALVAEPLRLVLLDLGLSLLIMVGHFI